MENFDYEIYEVGRSHWESHTGQGVYGGPWHSRSLVIVNL